MQLPFINPHLLYRFLSTRDEPYQDSHPEDVLFILGSGSLGPARKASRIYLGGSAKYIAFTSAGGNFGGNLVFGREEADEYVDFLSMMGVPERALLFPPKDKRTSNTLDEARGAIPFIESRIGKIRRLVLCSREVHQRRAWATFKKQYPDLVYLNRPDGEELTVELLPRLVQEIDRLRQYGVKGDVEVQFIPPVVSEICEQLRRQLHA